MFTEDVTVFFDSTDGHATDATLNGAAVAGVVDADFTGGPSLAYGHSQHEAGTTPRFVLASASVPASPLGKLLVIAAGPCAGTWRVADATHDGTGTCALLLTAT